MQNSRKNLDYPLQDISRTNKKSKRLTAEEQFNEIVKKAEVEAQTEIDTEAKKENTKQKAEENSITEQHAATPKTTASATSPPGSTLISEVELHKQLYGIWESIYPSYQEIFKTDGLLTLRLHDFNKILRYLLTEHQIQANMTPCPKLIESTIFSSKLSSVSLIAKDSPQNLLCIWHCIYPFYLGLFEKKPVIFSFLSDMNLMLTFSREKYHQLLQIASVMVWRTSELIKAHKSTTVISDSSASTTIKTTDEQKNSSDSYTAMMQHLKKQEIYDNPSAFIDGLNPRKDKELVDMNNTDKSSELGSELFSSSTDASRNIFALFGLADNDSPAKECSANSACSSQKLSGKF